MKSVKEIEVRYSETDQMGVVYHANYLVWLEIGRTTFLKDIGFDMMDIERNGYMFPVYSIDIKFINATRYGENIRIETYVNEISKIKMVYNQIVFNDNDEVKVRALVTIVCVRKTDFKAVRVDRELESLYRKLCLSSGG